MQFKNMRGAAEKRSLEQEADEEEYQGRRGVGGGELDWEMTAGRGAAGRE